MKGYVAKKGNEFYTVIYEVIDPVTGKEKRTWHPAGPDRAAAEQLARRLAAEAVGANDSTRSLTFGAYPPMAAGEGQHPRRVDWGDIDLDRATVSINRGRVAIGHELTESRSKTANSRRSIDLDLTTVNIVAAWKTWTTIERRITGTDSDQVFTTGEGVPVKVVSQRLGHATTALTIETYQHVLPGMQADTAHLFAALVDPSTGASRWKTRKKTA